MVVFRRAGREDLDAAKQVNRALVRRVWRFTRTYHRKLLLFLVVITVSALLGLVPPLLFKAIIDKAIPHHDRSLVTVLAAITVAAAFASALLDLAQRYLSAVIGEGVIFDLRTSLYDHVHRMPIAFFTRTQTGALVSRMNNDVIGAQRALTGTLGTVVGNFLTLATTLGAMVALDWRLTILAVVVLGGMGSQLGVILAAILLTVLPEVARDFAEYRMLIFGLVMVLMMMWRPQGLLPASRPHVELPR